jgi:hypothetical protein
MRSTKIKIDFERPTIKIDNSGTWDNLGYRDIVSFMKATGKERISKIFKICRRNISRWRKAFSNRKGWQSNKGYCSKRGL